MTAGLVALYAAVAFFVAVAVAALAVRRADPRWRKENWRGRQVPAVLGLVLSVSVSAAYGLALAGRRLPDTSAGVVVFAMYAMLLVGLIDDVRGGKERGFREHLGSLARLRPTTGVLKLVVGLGVAIGLAIRLGGGAVRVVAASLVIALAINVTNALDVRPGRALKWTLPVLAAGAVVTAGSSIGVVIAAAAAGAAGILAFDLAERGMLGDAGSNPLGLLSGLVLVLVLQTWAVVLAAAILLVLQVVAETVTISRLIETVPPLRWFDGLGR